MKYSVSASDQLPTRKLAVEFALSLVWLSGLEGTWSLTRRALFKGFRRLAQDIEDENLAESVVLFNEIFGLHAK
jgi:hypothetical protein